MNYWANTRIETLAAWSLPSLAMKLKRQILFLRGFLLSEETHSVCIPGLYSQCDTASVETVSYLSLSTMQLIFRKVADVKKEHELSERQKNEAPLDLPSDHPLRKLICRFRRRSERNLLSPFANHGATDPEIGIAADDASRGTSPIKELPVATSNDDDIPLVNDVILTPDYVISDF